MERRIWKVQNPPLSSHLLGLGPLAPTQPLKTLSISDNRLSAMAQTTTEETKEVPDVEEVKYYSQLKVLEAEIEERTKRIHELSGVRRRDTGWRHRLCRNSSRILRH